MVSSIVGSLIILPPAKGLPMHGIPTVNTREHLRQNMAVYIATGIIGPIIMTLAGAGLFTVLDARHEPRGAVIRSEISTIKREIRRDMDYLELAPSPVFDPARNSQIRFLNDEISRLEHELGEDR